MKEKVTRTFGFLKTTAIGGIIFLLPLAVIAALLGYVGQMVIMVYEPLKDRIPVTSAAGIATLLLVSVAILVTTCFLCGLAARRAIARQFSKTVEQYLVMMFPKYAIYKDILAGNIGGDSQTPTLTPVTIRMNDMIRIGYESGRTGSGLVIVYLPGAPDPWNGTVALVEADRVEPLEIDFNETSAICERLGRDSVELLAKVQTVSEPRP